MSCFYFCFFLLIFVFKVLGIPHPSQAISNDDWGAIATWLKDEMQSFRI